jgi:hypothetical protein
MQSQWHKTISRILILAMLHLCWLTLTNYILEVLADKIDWQRKFRFDT